jgi:hypothetical protein
MTGAVNQKTGDVIQGVMRSQIRVGSFNWGEYTDDERRAFILAKYWDDGSRAPPKDEETFKI